MTDADRKDPYSAFNFHVIIDGVTVGGFSEMSGLTAEGDAIDYRDATNSQSTVRKLVGLRKYTNITLKRGYTQDRSLWDWYSNVTNGQSDRRNITIELMNEARKTLQRWYLENACVTKIEGPSLKASGGEVTVETLEIAHEGLMAESSCAGKSGA
jgi:phage tail-like protein